MSRDIFPKKLVSKYTLSANLKEKLPVEVKILDCTPWFGSLVPGSVLIGDDRVEVSAKVLKTGIKNILAGYPAFSEEEQETVDKIRNECKDARIYAYCRAIKEEIDPCVTCDVDGVLISIPTSKIFSESILHLDEIKIIEKCVDAVDYSKDHGLEVAVLAEDSSRTDERFLSHFFREADSAGADWIFYSDTVGCLTPKIASAIIKKLKEKVNCLVGVDFRNNFGLSIGCALSCFEEGVSLYLASFNGCCSGCGCIPTENLVLDFEILYDFETGIDLGRLYEAARFIHRKIGVNVPPFSPLTGEKIFSRDYEPEAIAIISNPRSYEPYDPGIVKREIKYLVSLKSGRKLIQEKLLRKNYALSRKEIGGFVEIVRKNSKELKRCLTDKELEDALKKWMEIKGRS